MTTVPTTDVAVEAPTDFRGFRVLPRFEPGTAVSVHDRGDHVEKVLLGITYNLELRVLVVQMYEGMTTREHLWALFLVKDLVNGALQPCSWARCIRDGRPTELLTAELGYGLESDTDAEFDRLVARYYADADGSRA
ncbi:hypothetical protein [Clavibacter michiganensis]|uniref:Uncharacterized protein n=1 Tax=Clavibacter michiganensis TaxID=28447 RepID=A0A251YMP9_9MICO|nr:hypothetical protein [Clavibacter michiganensis]OUE25510.1 hypothetical protein BFL37_05865 [Clavibacter michiganensis]